MKDRQISTFIDNRRWICILCAGILNLKVQSELL